VVSRSLRATLTVFCKVRPLSTKKILSEHHSGQEMDRVRTDESNNRFHEFDNIRRRFFSPDMIRRHFGETREILSRTFWRNFKEADVVW
jgi:hypothetical protein